MEGIEATRVVWGQMLEGSARELLGMAEPAPDGMEGEANADVESFVRGLLAEGPVSVKHLKADADGAGYSWEQIKRAARRIGVERRKDGFKAGWVWFIEGGDPDPSAAPSGHGKAHPTQLRGSAEEFLVDQLSSGPKSASELMEAVAGSSASFSWAQVKRASTRLGVKKTKDGYQGGWTWALDVSQ